MPIDITDLRKRISEANAQKNKVQDTSASGVSFDELRERQRALAKERHATEEQKMFEDAEERLKVQQGFAALDKQLASMGGTGVTDYYNTPQGQQNVYDALTSAFGKSRASYDKRAEEEAAKDPYQRLQDNGLTYLDATSTLGPSTEVAQAEARGWIDDAVQKMNTDIRKSIEYIKPEDIMQSINLTEGFGELSNVVPAAKPLELLMEGVEGAVKDIARDEAAADAKRKAIEDPEKYEYYNTFRTDADAFVKKVVEDISANLDNGDGYVTIGEERYPTDVVKAMLPAVVYQQYHPELMEKNAAYRDKVFMENTGKTYKEYMKSHVDELKEEIKTLRDEAGEKAARGAAESTSMGSGGGTARIYVDRTAYARGAAEEPYNDVLEKIEAWEDNDFASGFSESFDILDFATLGLGPILEGYREKQIYDKVNNGETLLKSEASLLRLRQIEAEIEGLRDVVFEAPSIWSKIGSGLGSTVAAAPEFALAMPLTGGIGAAAKYGTKGALKSFIANKTLKNAAKLAGTATLDLAKYSGVNYARGMAAAPIMPSFYNGVLTEYNSQYSFDEDGNLKYSPKSDASMWLAGYVDAVNEVTSEHFGVGFGKVIGLGAKAFGKGLGIDKFFNKSVTGATIRRAAQAPLTQTAKKTLKNVGFSGAGDPVGEVFGDLMSQWQRRMVGADYSFEHFHDFDYWLTTLGVSALYGGALTLTVGAVNIEREAKMVKDIAGERKRILDTKIQNPELRDKLRVLADADNTVVAAAELSKFFRENPKLEDTDKGYALDFMKLNSTLKVVMGDVEEQERMQKFEAHRKEIEGRAYIGADGQPTNTIMQATDKNGNTYFVHRGDVSNKDAMIEVIDANTGAKNAIIASELTVDASTTVDSVLLDSYDQLFSVEDEVQRIKTAQETLASLENITIDDIETAAQNLDIALPKKGDVVTMVDGREVEVIEDMGDGTYIGQRKGIFGEAEVISFPFDGIRSNDSVTAEAQKVILEESLAAATIAEAATPTTAATPASQPTGINVGAVALMPNNEQVRIVEINNDGTAVVDHNVDGSGRAEDMELEVVKLAELNTPEAAPVTPMAEETPQADIPAAPQVEATTATMPQTSVEAAQEVQGASQAVDAAESVEQVPTMKDGTIDYDAIEDPRKCAQLMAKNFGGPENALAMVEESIEAVEVEMEKVAKTKAPTINDSVAKQTKIAELKARLIRYEAIAFELEQMMKPAEAKTESVEHEAGLVENEHTAGLPEAMRKSIDEMAKRAKVRIEFVDERIKGDAEQRGNLIRVSTRNRTKAVEVLVGHEMLHYMKSKMPEAYKAFKEAVIAFIGKDKFAKEVARRKKAYAAQNVELNDEDAAEEIVADYAGFLVQGRDVFEKFIEPKKSDNVFLRGLKKGLEYIRNIFGANGMTKQVKAVDNMVDALNTLINATVEGKDIEKIEEATAEEAKGEDNKTKHSLKAQPSLVGVHNISLDKLRKVIKMGGLANPSVAVIDVDKQTHDDYGDYTLVLPKNMVDARKGKNAGTWAGDAWTPTYPQVVKRMNDGKAISRFYKDIDALPEAMRNRVRLDFDSFMDGRDVGSLAYWYLYEKGVNPALVAVPSRYSDEVINALSEATNGTFNLYNLTPEALAKCLEVYIKAEHNGDKAAYEAKIQERKERLMEKDEAKVPDRVRKWAEDKVSELNEYGFDYGEVLNFVRDVESDVRKRGTVDVEATIRTAKDQIKVEKLDADYDTWLENLDVRYGIKEYIFNGYTYNGDRKYLPHTVENASKWMKKQGREGAVATFPSFGVFIANAIPKMTTLESIRKRKALLGKSNEEFETFKDKWLKVFHELGNKLQPDAKGFDDYGYWRLIEAVGKNNPKEFIKKEYGIELSEEDMTKFNDMVNAIRTEYPARYFETKFERPLQLSDFTAAVVPNDIPLDVESRLKDAGVEVIEYEKGDNASRAEAMQKASAMENVRFSLMDDAQAAAEVVPYLEAYNTDLTTFNALVNKVKDVAVKYPNATWPERFLKENYEDGKLEYVDKEKALNYLHHSAPIAEALSNPRLISATNIIQNFENPKIETKFSLSTAPTFYSNAEYAVQNIKQEKATPEQWLKMIEKNGGLKAGEDKWLGLSDWLKASDKKTLTKDEVLQYIAENDIQIEEVSYGEPEYISENEIYESDAFSNLVASLTDYDEDDNPYINKEQYKELQNADPDFLDGFSLDYWGEGLDIDDKMAAARYLGLLGVDNEINGTRLQYTTQGLTKKREIALVVPTIEPYNQSDDIHFGDAGEGRAVAWVRFGDAEAQRSEKVVRRVDEFETPYKDVNGHEIYRPKDRLYAKDFISYGKLKSGEYAYVVYVNDKQIPVAHKSLEDARNALNEHYKANPEKRTRWDKVLVIDEIQSKRHQDGREKGYKTAEDEELKNAQGAEIWAMMQKYNVSRPSDLRGVVSTEDATRLDELSQHKFGEVPSAPFEKNWAELAFKRMLRYAAENGYDYVAWTTGDQQAERYNIGSTVSRIVSYAEGENTKVSIKLSNNEPLNLTVNPNGEVTGSNRDIEAKTLSDVVGKELATKILNGEGEDITVWDGKDIPAKEISGDGLRIGGEGMKAFYDQMLPSFVKKYTKKWGAEVKDITMPDLEENNTMHAVNVTDSMRESVMQGQPKFSLQETNDRFNAELDAFKAGTHKGLLHLGYPSEILKVCGVGARELTISPRELSRHLKKHNLTTDDLRDLVYAIQEPIMVYKHGKKHPNIVVITEVMVNKGKLSVSIELDDEGNVVEISNISSVHSKDALIELDRLSELSDEELKKALKWVDKEKVSGWLMPTPYMGSGASLDPKHLSTAKIIQDFENPKVSTKKSLITPEMDASYLDAVERGDMTTAQKMVMEAAKLAMPNTKVVDENGNPKVVYHGTPNYFNAFSKEMFGTSTDRGIWGNGFYFSEDGGYAKQYQKRNGADGRTLSLFLSLKNPLFISLKDGGNEGAMYFHRLNEKYFTDDIFEDAAKVDENMKKAQQQLSDNLIADGYDGVVIEYSHPTIAQEYVAFEPNQIKSADPVTYDDNGNVIPLSERFNPEKEDIRYSLPTDLLTDFAEEFNSLQKEYESLAPSTIDYKHPFRVRKREVVQRYADHITEVLGLPCEVFVIDATDAGQVKDAYDRYKQSHQLLSQKNPKRATKLASFDKFESWLKNDDGEYAFGMYFHGTDFIVMNISDGDTYNEQNGYLQVCLHENVHGVMDALRITDFEKKAVLAEGMKHQPKVVINTLKGYEKEDDATKGEELIAFAINTRLNRKFGNLLLDYFEGNASEGDIWKSYNLQLPLRLSLTRKILNYLKDGYERKQNSGNASGDTGGNTATNRQKAKRFRSGYFEENPRNGQRGSGAVASLYSSPEAAETPAIRYSLSDIPFFDAEGNAIDMSAISEAKALEMVDSRVRTMLEDDYNKRVIAIAKEAKEARKATRAYYAEERRKRRGANAVPRTNYAKLQELFADTDISSLPLEVQALIRIASGDAKIYWADRDGKKGLASELGLKDSATDKKAMQSIWSGATQSFDEVVHNWWESINGYERGIDTQDLRNALIDALLSFPNSRDAMRELQSRYDAIANAEREALEEIDRREGAELDTAKTEYMERQARFELSEGEEREALRAMAVEHYSSQPMSAAEEALEAITAELNRVERRLEVTRKNSQNQYAAFAEALGKGKEVILRTLEGLRMFSGMDSITLEEVAKLIAMVRTARSKAQLDAVATKAKNLVQRIAIKKARENMRRLLELKLSNVDVIQQILKESNTLPREERDALLKSLWKVSRNGWRATRAVHPDTKEVFKMLNNLVRKYKKKVKVTKGHYSIDAALAEVEKKLHPGVVIDKQTGKVVDNSALPTDYDNSIQQTALFLFKTYLEVEAKNDAYRAAAKKLRETAKDSENFGAALAEMYDARDAYLAALKDYNATLEGVIVNGKDDVHDFNIRKEKHATEIRQMGIEAIGGAPASSQGKAAKGLMKIRAGLNTTVNAPFWTFEMVLERIDHLTPYKQGRFYEYFMRKFSDANNALFINYSAHMSSIGEAMAKCFPSFAKSFGIIGRNPFEMYKAVMRKAQATAIGTLEYVEKGRRRTMILNVANAMYIIAMWRQPRYRAAMEANAISQKKIDAMMAKIKEANEGYIPFMNWVNDTFLPGTRLEYDVVHRNINGGSMAKEENYFPAKVAAHQEVKLDDQGKGKLPTSPSAIKERVSHGLMPQMGMDYFRVLEAHIQDMDKWSAFAELTEDLNILLSSDEFRRRLNEYMPGLAGDGSGAGSLYKMLYDTALIATGNYRSSSEQIIGGVQKAWATSNIAFRLWTAVKQISSVSVGITEHYYFGKHLLKTATMVGIHHEWKRAMEISPSLRNRWQSKAAGMEALMRETSQRGGYTTHRGTYEKVHDVLADLGKKAVEVGMTPNAAVDAVACAILINSVYDKAIYDITKGKREATEEEKKIAVRKAEIAFNSTQQSSEGAYLSAAQANPLYAPLTTYMNASFALHRKRMSGIRELWRIYTSKEYRAFLKEEFGVDAYNISRNDAIKDIIRGIVGDLAFSAMGWGLMNLASWITELFGGDADDDDDIAAERRSFFNTFWMPALNGYLGGGIVASTLQGYDTSITPAYDELIKDIQGVFDDKGTWWYEAVEVCAKYGVGIDLKSIKNVAAGIENMWEDDGEKIPAVLKLINAPERYVKAFAGDRRAGETIEEYMTRILQLQSLFVSIKYEDFVDENGKYIGDDTPLMLMSKTEANKFLKEYDDKRIENILREYGDSSVFHRWENIDSDYREILKDMHWGYGTKPSGYPAHSKQGVILVDLDKWKSTIYAQASAANVISQRQKFLGEEETIFELLIKEMELKEQVINSYYGPANK